MPQFSKKSLERLSECHIDLQRVMKEVIKRYDITVTCGYRGEQEQEEAFKNGNSRAKFGQSKHNHFPSLAVDVVPFPVDWEDIPRFEEMGNVVLEEAEKLGIKLKWGRDFKKLKDYPHFELI